MALDMADTDLVWRVDDDNIADPNCLEILMSNMKENVGAVGGCVFFSGQILPPSIFAATKIADLGFNSGNIQWYKFSGKKEVDSLYSTFLYRVKAAKEAGGYCMNLSRVGHREETIFSHQIYRKGWKIIIDPDAVTRHFAQPEGGIRSFKNPKLWQHDEHIFEQYLKEWNIKFNIPKFIILDCGKGDTVCFLNILPELKEKYKNQKIIIAVCYPELFEDEKDITLISIGEAKSICNSSGLDYESFNIYKWCIDHNWQSNIIEAYKQRYL
jgi:hypothetical protein